MTPDLIGQPDSALSLSLAMLESSRAPLLLLDGELRLVGASASFCDAFELAADDIKGKMMSELGSGEWAVPQLTSLIKATALGQAAIDSYQMDLKRDGREARCVTINARKLSYGEGASVRLLVAIDDITEQRAADKHRDDLVREKAILLQELQHRVANSLQIIASVLMQSARTVSAEAKAHIFAAHNRVVSVAAIQEHLSPSQLSDVAVKPYLTGLCESIGASMIHDHKLVTIEVGGDEATVRSDMSVSIGLVVTELVINALKHAFPGGRSGKIQVAYWVKPSGWTLSVSDDGIGMPSQSSNARAGLGTTIVKSLAEQLKAHIEVADGNPGTHVSVIQNPNDGAEGNHPKYIPV